MKAAAIALSLALAASVAAGEAKAIKSLKLQKPVEGKAPSGGETVVCLELDSEIYASCKDGFADLRVFDGDAEIPFAIRKAPGKAETRSSQYVRPSKIAAFLKLPDNRVEAVLERVEDEGRPLEPVNALAISSSTKNFDKTLSVFEGPSVDGPWTEIAKDVPVFDYSDCVDFSKRNASFQKSVAPFLKVSISNYREDVPSPATGILKEFGSDGAQAKEYQESLRRSVPLKIDRITLLGPREESYETKEALKAYPVRALSTKEDGKKTVVGFESSREPLRKLRLSTDSANFIRRASLEASEDGKSWRLIAEATLSSVGAGQDKESRLEFEIPETRFALYRIAIENGDAPPLKISSVEASGAVYQAELIAPEKPDAKLRLLYGGGSVEAPSYDAAEVIARLKRPDFVVLRLGPQEANPEFGSENAALKAFDGKTILGAIAVAIAALMGFLLFKNIKKIDSISE